MPETFSELLRTVTTRLKFYREGPCLGIKALSMDEPETQRLGFAIRGITTNGREIVEPIIMQVEAVPEFFKDPVLRAAFAAAL